MESEHTAKTLQIALGSYDRKELRVEKNYLQEQSPALECTCFQNGGRLLEQLRQGRQFDVVILCSQLEAKPSAKWLRFKDESGFADEKPTTGKLIYTVKNYLQRQKDD